ncbi:hypothetical protein K0A97_03210 [Patescibacteria group bacterium]|nr:hypothetical protein [Patescibacteria group bacterium]
MEFKPEYYIIILFTIALFFTLGISIGSVFQFEDLNNNNGLSKNVSNFNFSDVEIKKSLLPIPGVDNDGKGVAAFLETTIREGSGFTLVNINELTAGSSTQNSARVAVRTAKDYLGLDNDENLDVIYSIKTNAGFIDGPSAGAAMAVSLVSLLEDKPLNKTVAITGFVDEDGTIGPASGIEQKASALKAEGIEILLVSDQISLPRDYVKKESCGFINGLEYCEVNYIAEGKVIISGVTIIPVKDLEEAMGYFYGEIFE